MAVCIPPYRRDLAAVFAQSRSQRASFGKEMGQDLRSRARDRGVARHVRRKERRLEVRAPRPVDVLPDRGDRANSPVGVLGVPAGDERVRLRGVERAEDDRRFRR
jgi:hypothetical protein